MSSSSSAHEPAGDSSPDDSLADDSSADDSSGDARSNHASDGPSEVCANCGAPLVGAYCAECGQKDVDRVRPLHELGMEALQELIAWDLRVGRTFKALLFHRPGRLTRAYLAGQRRSYTSPLRLFLGTSLVYFLLLAAPTQIAQFTGDGPAVSPGAAASPATADNAVVTPSTRLPPLEMVVYSMTKGFADAQSADGTDSPATQALRRIETDRSFLRTQASRIGNRLSTLVLAFFPVLALFLKALVPRRIYVAHLVFSLHTHVFAFVVLTFTSACGLVLPDLPLVDYLLVALASVFIGSYVLRAFRAVYDTSWLRALVSTLVLLILSGSLFALSIAGFVILLVTA